MEQITYFEGYKYQMAADYSVSVPILPETEISGRFIKLTTDGILTIRQDYAWDGPSGPTVDTADAMRGSLVHDALYQLMREGDLDETQWRPMADKIFHTILLEDGMSELRAAVWYRGVQKFGEPSANPSNQKQIMTAPKESRWDTAAA